MWAETNRAFGGGRSVSYVEIPETGHMLLVAASEELAGANDEWVRSTLT